MVFAKRTINNISLFTISAMLTVVFTSSAQAATKAKPRWRTIPINQIRFLNNGESANVTRQGNQIHMEMLNDGGTTVVDLKQGYAKRVKRANFRVRIVGCATTPIGVSVNFGLGTEFRGANWVVGSQTADFQSRKLLGMVTSQPTSGAAGTILAESAWMMRFLIAESTVEMTVTYNRNGFTGNAIVSHSSTGKRREGQTSLRMPKKLGALPRHFFFIAPVLEQGLNDACKVVITRMRAYY